MKVLFVTHYSSLYGANKSLLDLLDGLSIYNGQLSIEVITPNSGPIINELLKRKIKIYRSCYTNDVYLSHRRFELCRIMIKYIINFFSILSLLIRLNRKDIDIIHTNSSVTFLGAYLSMFLKKKHVWHIREFVYQYFKYKYMGGNNYFNKLLKKSYVIAISESIYIDRLAGINESSKIMIRDGIIYLQDISKHIPFSEDIIKFGIVGFISEGKGQLEALKAFNLFQKDFPISQLYIVGNGDETYIKILELFIQENNLCNKVIFTGHISDIKPFYQTIDVYLMCSRNEALGRVTIEAMSKGVPVIGYNNAGTAEIVKDKYNGLLYEGGYIELYEKMKFINNNDLLTYLSSNSLISVQKEFLIDKYVEKILFVYKNIIISQ